MDFFRDQFLDASIFSTSFLSASSHGKDCKLPAVPTLQADKTLFGSATKQSAICAPSFALHSPFAPPALTSIHLFPLSSPTLSHPSHPSTIPFPLSLTSLSHNPLPVPFPYPYLQTSLSLSSSSSLTAHFVPLQYTPQSLFTLSPTFLFPCLRHS